MFRSFILKLLFLEFENIIMRTGVNARFLYFDSFHNYFDSYFLLAESKALSNILTVLTFLNYNIFNCHIL